jgi:hypothetical protein
MTNKIETLEAANARIAELEAILATRKEEIARLQKRVTPGPLSEREKKIQARMRLGGRGLSRQQAEIAVDGQEYEDARSAAIDGKSRS